MNRLARALGVLVVTVLVAAGLAVGASAPSVARGGPTAPAARLGELTGSLPVISGTGAVGSPLGLTLPVWSLPGVTNSVQWLSNGSPIAGQTGLSYVPVVGDVGNQITAAVTGTVDVGLTQLQLTLESLPITVTEPPGGLPDLVTPPQLTGDPVVGGLLTVLAPVFSLPGVDTAYQWLRDGAPIPGVTGDSYVPGLDDAGHEISVLVTSTLGGIPVLSTVTNILPISDTGETALSATSAPTVSGTSKVGGKLDVTGAQWDQEGVSTEYQWLRDGVPINGAVGEHYVPKPEDLGSAISAKATGTKEGFTNGVVVSNAQTVTIGDAIKWTRQPAVSGTPKAGRLLTADPGTWGAGETPLFTYQWKRDGAPISGAVAQTYQVDAADAGHTLAVTVTAARSGYQPGTFTTSAIQVAKLASSLKATLAKKTVKKGQRATLALLLKVAGVASPTGVVKVLEGKKTLGTVTLAPGKAGKAKLKLPKLKPGVHKLQAVYAGSSTVAAATSKVVRLTVKKKK
jgi:hypothetical protein